MRIQGLNDKQREAVLSTEGPVLVLAGAGSGKTTVLVTRIAYILENRNVSAHNIIAITFTNKAANEMKTRIGNMIGEKANGMWVSTFHSACVKILRNTIECLGFTKNFVIYDSDDCKTVLKECLKELNMDEKVFPVRSMMTYISKAKDELISPEEYEVRNFKDYRLSKIAAVYSLYQQKLKKNNAVDFDDIIYFTVKILKENRSVTEYYQHKFQYIMVDEYQDTSTAQYMLVSLLAGGTRNICVVGDDDQSIYKFRGANIRNILDFEKEFKDAKIIKLEQNYRSSQNILNAANAVIKNNSERKEKALWTSNEKGEAIKLYTGNDERDEAGFIADEIAQAVEDGAKYSDFAILYRTNAQSRVIEDTFIRNVIPYRILSGLRFYDRKEIKDIIAYLRVILNPADDVSLQRIINEPKRGIGKTTLDKASQLADMHLKSMFEIIAEPDKYPEILRASSKLEGFVTMINELRRIRNEVSVVELIEKTLMLSGYMTALELENTVESETRIENIKEFISVAAEFTKTEEDTSFEAFLENITLVSNIDFYDEDEEYAVMMTIHSAKGLEFPYVFVTGLEEGLFPSLRGVSEMQEKEELEEERRLCYVAVTRAKQRLYITNAQNRTVYGRTTYQRPSRFIGELELKSEKPKSTSKYISIEEYLNKAPKIPMPTFTTQKGEKAPERENLKTASPLKKGDIVMHKKFGRGMIVNAKQYGKDTLVEVAFDSVGTKQLMANFAKLEVIKED